MTRARTSPLADELARDARSSRHLRVRTTRLPGGRQDVEPVGPALTGPDALILAETPAAPLARARLDAIQLHGVLSMAGDPFEDPAVIEAEVTQLLATIAREWSAHKEASDVR